MIEVTLPKKPSSVCFINRVWLSKTKLKNVKFKIVIFKPELLSGKIPKDPQAEEATKPVRQQRFCHWARMNILVGSPLAHYNLMVCFPVNLCQILSTCVPS